MKQVIFFGLILAFLCGCGDTDDQNAKYVKSVQDRNKYIDRDLRQKDQVKNTDTTINIVPSKK